MLTAAEVLAVTVALRAAAATPFAAAARQATLKVLAVLPSDVRRREEAMAGRVHRVGDQRNTGDKSVAAAVVTAVSSGLVVTVDYAEADHRGTVRDVEPMGLLWGLQGWYLMGWCRLRDRVRGFLLSRITAAKVTERRAPERDAALYGELDRLDAQPLRTESAW